MKAIKQYRDFLYIIIFLILVIVSLSAYKFSGDEQLLNYISFSANIISIILAVVAITYAFHQSRESNLQNNDLRNGINDISKEIIKGNTHYVRNSNEIKNIMSSLNSFPRELKEDELIEYKEMVKTLESKIHELEQNYQEVISSTSDLLNQSILISGNTTANHFGQIDFPNHMVSGGFKASKVEIDKEP